MFTFAIVYISLPVFLVLFTFFSTPYVLLSAVALVVLVFYLYSSWQSTHDKNFCWQSLARYWPLLLVALIITCLCVISPSVSTYDWEKNYPVFNLLIEKPWPHAIAIHEQDYFLRYYVAWYVVPALFAKIFGAQLLTVFITIWTAIGIVGMLFLAFSHLNRTSHLFVAVLIFFFFSGLDILYAFYYGYVEPINSHWLQWYNGWGHIGSNIFNAAWIPQHLIACGIGACIFFYNRRLAVQYGALILAVISMWSPLCAIGIFPMAAYALVKEGYRTSLTSPNLLIAPLILVPIALYLTQGTGQIPFMFVWEFHSFLFSDFVLFCIVEFLLMAFILFIMLPQQRFLISILCIFLTALCLVRYGASNDLLMRASMPAICVMAMLAVKALLEIKDWRQEVLVVYLLVAAFPPAVAFANGFKPSVERVDKTLNFKKFIELSVKNTRHNSPAMGARNKHQYLAKVNNMAKLFGTPLLRNLSLGSEGRH